MKLLERITKSHWDNGQPSIDINPYEYSDAGFNSLLAEISRVLDADTPDFVLSMETYLAEIEMQGSTVTVHMDRDTCSISFTTVDLRESVFQKIKNKN